MSAAEELKQRAAQLQDRLADQHVQFMQAAAQAPPEAAAKWQAEWSSAVREVSAAQDRLRGEASQGVDLHTADALSSVQRASDRLGSELEGLRRKGG